MANARPNKSGNLRRYYNTPLDRYMTQASIRDVDIASRAGVSLATVYRLRRLDASEVARMKCGDVARVALALGVAPAELVPWLAARPTSGLLHERGFFRAPKAN